MTRRAVALAFGLSIALLSHPVPADASASGGAWTNGDEVGAEAGRDGDGGGGAGGGQGGGGPIAETCEHERLTEAEEVIAREMADLGIGVDPGDGEGGWWRQTCVVDGTSRSIIVWLPARPDPATLAVGAFDVERIPLPDINLNPPAGSDQVVNVESWMWVDDWAPVSATASAGGVSVTVTAAPQYVTWDMGDGGTVRCDGPGRRYDESRAADEQSTDCSYVYRRSSAGEPEDQYRIVATSYWHVTWAASNGASGDFGLVGRTSSRSVRVAEIQAVNG